MNPCDVDPSEGCTRVLPAVPGDLASLVGQPVLVTAGSMAFHGWLDEVTDHDLLVRAPAWTRRILRSSVTRVAASKRTPGRPNNERGAPVRTASKATDAALVVPDGPARTCARCRTPQTSYVTETVALSWGGTRRFHTCSICAGKAV